MPTIEPTFTNFAVAVLLLFVGAGINWLFKKAFGSANKADEVSALQIQPPTSVNGNGHVTEPICKERRRNIDKQIEVQNKAISESLVRIEGKQDTIFEEIGKTNINVGQLSGKVALLTQQKASS